MIQDNIQHIVRRAYPSSIKADLISEMPIPNPDIELETVEILEIDGGHYHDFLTGFGYNPYLLCKKWVTRPVIEPEGFYIIGGNVTEVLETWDDSEIDFEIVKAKWQPRIDEFNKKRL